MDFRGRLAFTLTKRTSSTQPRKRLFRTEATRPLDEPDEKLFPTVNILFQVMHANMKVGEAMGKTTKVRTPLSLTPGCSSKSCSFELKLSVLAEIMSHALTHPT